MAPMEKGGDKGRSAFNSTAIREHTINVHKDVHGMGFKKHAPRAHRKIWKFAVKEVELQECALAPGSTTLSGPKE